MICYGLFKEVANGSPETVSRNFDCGVAFHGGDRWSASSFLPVGDDLVGGV